MTALEVFSECEICFKEFLEKMNKYKDCFEVRKNDIGDFIIECDLDLLERRLAEKAQD